MTVPFSLFLYAFLGIVGIVVVATAVNLYHLGRFGYFTPGVIIMAIAAIAVPAAILLTTFGSLSGVNWSDSGNIQLPSVSPSLGNSSIGNLGR